jgi:archaellum component FlaG (FlaF/FlaG flagellin family)
MGFGTSMTQAIFFIASAVIALAIVGVATVSVNSLANSFNAKAGQLSDQIKTEVKLTGDTCYLGGNSYVYAKNTGNSFLDANSTNIFVDGGAYPVNAIDIFKNNTWVSYPTLNVWEPGQMARFTTGSSLPTGYHKLRVVTQHGVYDSLEYSDC